MFCCFRVKSVFSREMFEAAQREMTGGLLLEQSAEYFDGFMHDRTFD